MSRQVTPSAGCPQVVLDWIAWYPEGELPANVRSAIELHAAECAACRTEIASLAGEESEDAAAAEGAERVFSRTLERIAATPRRATPPAAQRLWRVRPRLAVAAGLAVAFISGTAGVIATRAPWSRLDPVYEPATLGSEQAHPAVGAHLDVVFRGDASFAEITRAIQAIGASVDSGPTPSGVVHLRLAEGADAAAAALRLESGDPPVAEFAQPAP